MCFNVCVCALIMMMCVKLSLTSMETQLSQADGVRTDYDAGGNEITEESEKRDAVKFNVNDLKKKHVPEVEPEPSTTAASNNNDILDLDKLISQFQLTADIKSTFEASELESHLYVLLG